MDRRTASRDGASTESPNELYRLLVDSVIDYAIFALDRDGRVLSWNPGARRLKGYAADEIIGRHFSIFYPPDDLLAGKPAHELEVAARTGRFEDEGWRLRKDGSRFWANVIISALRSAEGEVIGFAKVTRDLTARREAEDTARRLAAESAAREEAERHGEELAMMNDQLQQQAIELEQQTEEAQALTEELEHANDELQRALWAAERANRAKSEFLAVMSHELRTPLNAIAGYTELMSMGIRGPVTPAQRVDLDRIMRSQRSLLALINDVLNFAKLEAGRVEFATRSVRVGDLLADLEALVLPQLEAKGLHYRCEGCAPDLRVSADAEKAQQILLNLLSNAIKFTTVGGRITVNCEADDATVRIRVHDTGIGIPADKLDTIFEPFVQLHRDLTSTHEGTGLGLAISRDLARAMAGDLTVESASGEGAVFTLRLPRARGNDEGAAGSR